MSSQIEDLKREYISAKLNAYGVTDSDVKRDLLNDAKEAAINLRNLGVDVSAIKIPYPDD